MTSARATDDFVTFLLSIQHVEPITVLSVFFLTLARIVPLIAIVPFLGAKLVPRTVRMMFAVSLAVLFMPFNLTMIQEMIPYATAFIGLMLKELAIGFFLAFIATIPFLVAQSAGTLIDHSRGAASLQVSDPTTQTQTGPIGLLYNYVLISTFFSLGGPFLFFNAVATSYQIVPVDKLIDGAFFNLTIPFWKQLINVLQRIMNLAIQLSAPSLIGILLSDLFLGIANRLAPQVQVVFLGIPLKSWVGIALMTAAWTLIIQVLGRESIAWIKLLHKNLTQAGAYLAK